MGFFPPFEIRFLQGKINTYLFSVISIIQRLAHCLIYCSLVIPYVKTGLFVFFTAFLSVHQYCLQLLKFCLLRRCYGFVVPVLQMVVWAKYVKTMNWFLGSQFDTCTGFFRVLSIVWHSLFKKSALVDSDAAFQRLISMGLKLSHLESKEYTIGSLWNVSF